MNMSEQLYRQLLAQHDWYYPFSDDYSVWAKGKAHVEKIQGLQKHIDPDYQIWNSIAPEDCRVNKEPAK